MQEASGEGGDNATDRKKAVATAQKIAAQEVMRKVVAVDMQDIAKHLQRTTVGRGAMEQIAAFQEKSANPNLVQALAVPTGKPLSMFDSAALPAAYTEFLFGDCVPFLDRETPVTCQQVFDALPSREELEYSMPDDTEQYKADSRSRFDTPEFYGIFASFLRKLRLFQSTKAAISREGFQKDMKLIASISSDDIVEAALHESAPRTSEALATVGNLKVRTALRHLEFSTATVPLTDGNKMRLHHFGNAMQRIFWPFKRFSHAQLC